MVSFVTKSAAETEELAAQIAEKLMPGTVIAFFGGITRGLARGLGLDSHVSSPTFAIVNDYGGNPPLVHFDMYRVTSWDDLYTTGFYDYMDMGAILAVEWSENIENAIPENAVRITIEQGGSDDERIITIDGIEV